MDDRILETHVIKWMKSARLLDAQADRFEPAEWQAYSAIRDIFSKNRPNMQLLANSCEGLRQYLDGGVKDEVYTAVRDFLKTTDIARENFRAFKELLEDRGFFAPQAAAPAAASGGRQEAKYCRVESGGNVYEGMFIGDDRVLKGKIRYKSGNIYEGEWDNNGPQGEGVFTGTSGTRYIGRFDGLAGSGKIENTGGDYVLGTWNQRGKHYGQCTCRQGNRTDKGQYEDGSRVGTGRMEWDNGDWYEGGWNDNGPHGQGTWRQGNRTDKGQYANSKRVGKGRMEWDNGDWYEGEWNENGAHGHGTLYSASEQRTDIGTWENHKQTGDLVMKWQNGDVYRGTGWRDGADRLNGEGEYFYASTGRTRKGKYIDGDWHNNWATRRNVIGAVLFFICVMNIFSGNWGWGIALAIIGKLVYEGK